MDDRQRAFRERKEKHVKDLQVKVSGLEDETAALRTENDRLRNEVARVTAENDILRAVSGSTAGTGTRTGTGAGAGAGTGAGAGAGTGAGDVRVKEEEPTVGPMRYKPIDLTTAPDLVSGPGSSHTPTNDSKGTGPGLGFGSDTGPQAKGIHRVTYCPVTGDKLLDASAAWDLIQSHELAEQGLLDMEALSGRLKSMATCNGQGPAFREGEVRKAILLSHFGSGSSAPGASAPGS